MGATRHNKFAQCKKLTYAAERSFFDMHARFLAHAAATALAERSAQLASPCAMLVRCTMRKRCVSYQNRYQSAPKKTLDGHVRLSIPWLTTDHRQGKTGAACRIRLVYRVA